MPTFAVADVAADRSPLPTVPGDVWVRRLGLFPVDAHALGAHALVDGPAIHPLALAAQLSFATHRPLTLSPDAIWLTLAQGLAQHVDLHADALRPRLVRHDGKRSLDVRRDDFIPGDPSNDWPGAVNALAAQLEEHLGGRARLFVSDFSTTTPVDLTASQVALMGAMRNYFDYSVSTLCGIPEITLTGRPDDWASIRRRVQAFGEFDLTAWAARLDPILAQLEATSRGKVDRGFWRRFYKLEHASGGDRFQGWLADLFPYLGAEARPNPFEDFDPDNPFDGLKPSELPSGRTQTPFTWKRLTGDLPRLLTAGLFGVAQQPGGAIAPVSGWTVCGPKPASGFRATPGPITFLQASAPVESLEGLQHEDGEAPTRLWLYPMPTLTSLNGLAHLRGLTQLTVHSAPLLTSADLANPRLTHLELNACAALERLTVAAPLESLAVLGCPKLPASQLPVHRGMKSLMLVGWDLPPELRKHTTDPAQIARIVNALQGPGS